MKCDHCNQDICSEVEQCLRVGKSAMAMLADVCAALGVPVPEKPRFDGGSGFAGGSAYEARLQDEWDASLREQVRRALSGRHP